MSFVDRESFQAEAIATLRQEVPEDLEWLPWRQLPAMRWAEDGTPVDDRVPRGWLVASATSGCAEPDASLQERAELFDRRDAAALGAWLLRVWIEHDTAEPELTEARKSELRAIAERGAEMAKRFGRGGTDADERYRQLLAQESDRPAASALPHKGLLAVVAACADDSVVGDVERYLSARREERPEQSQSLLRMLSWIDSSAANELRQRHDLD